VVPRAPSSTSVHAATNESAISGVSASSAIVHSAADRPSEICVAIASGAPSGSARQKRAPYARIVSATSWPTVRSAGGSGGGSSRVRSLELLEQ